MSFGGGGGGGTPPKPGDIKPEDPSTRPPPVDEKPKDEPTPESAQLLSGAQPDVYDTHKRPLIG